ncbi:SlyX family protein [Roseibium denhamense]|uniref:SlyX protein n=1 Tax=Roseibium denhamense TaxID=76305 RepID=A0ABY1P3Z8_9HYPH|nr:SlyX family protein [Roseibium denhamense]MTI07666.1 SlyX family protein [Roseibium denhamense]SMP24400.1 SlyX protein [Roseibium denhamense]
MPSNLDDRLEKLEIDLSHANHTIDELNTVVIDQGREIERLKRLIASMTDQVEELMESLPGHQVDKPPHY